MKLEWIEGPKDTHKLYSTCGVFIFRGDLIIEGSLIYWHSIEKAVSDPYDTIEEGKAAAEAMEQLGQ
mgnify:CR=1 FL=1